MATPSNRGMDFIGKRFGRLVVALNQAVERYLKEVRALNADIDELRDASNKSHKAVLDIARERDTLRTTLEAVEKERDELREQRRKLGDLLGSLLNKVNAVTAEFRHMNTIDRRAVAELCERQIEVEQGFAEARALLASRAEPPSGEGRSGG